MQDRSSSQTQTGQNRSAMFGGDVQPKFGFPKSSLQDVTRDLTSYVLIDPETGRIWTSENDKQAVHNALSRAGITPEQVG